MSCNNKALIISENALPLKVSTHKKLLNLPTLVELPLNQAQLYSHFPYYADWSILLSKDLLAASVDIAMINFKDQMINTLTHLWHNT